MDAAADARLRERFGRDAVVTLATAAHLRQVFADWIDNGHNDLASPETRILRIRLTGGALFWHGARFDLGA